MSTAAPLAAHRLVVRLTLRSWWNQLLLDLGGSRLHRGLLVGGASALLGLWALFGLITSLTQPVAQAPASELVEVLGLQLLAITILLGPLIIAVLLVFSPPRSRLIDLMAPLPIPRRAVNLGTELPLIVIAFLALSAVLAPIAGSSLRLMPAGMAWSATALLVLGGAVGTTIGWLVFRVVCWLGTEVLRVPLALSRSAAGLVNIGLACAGIATLNLGTVSQAPALVAFVPLSADGAAGTGGLPAVLVGGLVLLGLLIQLGASVPDPSESGSAQVVPVLRGMPVGSRRALLRAEALQWLRHPLVVSAETLMVVTVAACALFVPSGTTAWMLLSHLLLIASTTGSGVFGWGLNRSTAWVHEVNGSSVSRLFWSKLTVSAIISSAVFIISWILIAWNEPIPAQSLIVLLPLCLTGFCATFLAGIVFPVDQEQSLSSAMALLGTLVITLALGLGLSQLQMIPEVLRGGIAVLVALVTLLMARSYALSSVRRPVVTAG